MKYKEVDKDSAWNNQRGQLGLKAKQLKNNATEEFRGLKINVLNDTNHI